MTLRRRLSNLLCVLRHGNHSMYWPAGQTPDVPPALIAACRHCGHVAAIDLADLPRPRPRHAGDPARHRLAGRLRLVRGGREAS